MDRSEFLKKYRILWLSAAVFLLGLGSVLAGEKASSSKDDLIQKWILQLNHDDFLMREKATKALIQLGKELPLAERQRLVARLEKALPNANPEVQWRLKMVLKRLRPTSSLRSRNLTPSSPKVAKKPPSPRKGYNPGRIPRPRFGRHPRFHFRYRFGSGPSVLKSQGRDPSSRKKRILSRAPTPELPKFQSSFEQQLSSYLKRFQEVWRKLYPMAENPVFCPSFRLDSQGRLRGIFRITYTYQGREYRQVWSYQRGKWIRFLFSAQAQQKIAKSPKPRKTYRLGVVVRTLDSHTRYHFRIQGPALLVVALKPSSRAERAGVRLYDILLAFNRQPIQGIAHLRRLVQEAGDGEIQLDILRGRRKIRLHLPALNGSVPKKKKALELPFLPPGKGKTLPPGKRKKKKFY
ncbi:MAG: PDZ domain-containing protein [Planctomycetota bacterium]|nr:MAG: PDZ domain-containing protein [Planctomycetota bacterium]